LELLIDLLNGDTLFRFYPMGMDIPEWFHFAFLFLASIIPLTLVTCLFIPEKQINKSLFGLIALLFTPLYFVLIQHPTSWDDNYTFFIWGSLMAFSLGMAALFLFKKAQEKYSAVILGSLAAALIFWLTPLNLIPHPQFQSG
jgi:peptidoglycan/LPS O-acetylase OafA/YrhL